MTRRFRIRRKRTSVYDRGTNMRTVAEPQAVPVWLTTPNGEVIMTVEYRNAPDAPIRRNLKK